MKVYLIFSQFLLLLFVIGSLSGCAATKGKMYENIPVAHLTDEQLVQEMEKVYTSLEERYSREELLMALKPDPAYVLTSSYTAWGSAYSVNMITYTMPHGYRPYHVGSFGKASTKYSYTDADAFFNSLRTTAQLISQYKIGRLRERGNSVVSEFQTKAEERRKKTEMAIEQFFVRNPDLTTKKTLLAAILPWVASEKNFLSDAEMLDDAGNTVRNLQTSEEFKHTWFGIFSMIDRLPDGKTMASSNFIVTKLRVIGDVLTGEGNLGTGEKFSLQANVTGRKWKGVVETERASFECAGTISDTELFASFRFSVLGRDLEILAVLLR